MENERMLKVKFDSNGLFILCTFCWTIFTVLWW